MRISSCSDSFVCKRLGFWVLLLFALACDGGLANRRGCARVGPG